MSWTMYLYTHNDGSIGINEVMVRRTTGTSLQSTGNKYYDMYYDAGTLLDNGAYAHILENIQINNSSSADYDIRFSCTDISNDYEFVCWHYNIVGDSGTWYDYDGNEINSSDTYESTDDDYAFSFFLPEDSGIIQIWPEAKYVGGTGTGTGTGTGSVWIYTYSNGWVQATPYVYTYSNGWVQATPYVYTYSNGWVECT